MRQNTSELNLESSKIVPSSSDVAKRCGMLPNLRSTQAYILGANGAGKSSAYWQGLQMF
jgi:hypothetical protein